MMINRNLILKCVSVAAILSLIAAYKLFELKVITDNGFYVMQSIGIALLAIRIRMQTISLLDALINNIAVWLCVFNVHDELFSADPTRPYKPWITTIIVIISSLLIYRHDTKRRRIKRPKRPGI